MLKRLLPLALACATVMAIMFVAFGSLGQAAEPNQFHLDCDIHSVKVADPIRPDMDHLHAIAGNRSLSDTSTYQSLLNNRDTSCEQSFVTSAYWTPATWWNNVRYDPSKIAVYYFSNTPQSVNHIPDGLKMLSTRENGEITFKCGKDPTTGYLSPNGINGCKQDFRIVFKFPECWDGSSLEPESLTMRSGANCPAGTQKIVALRTSFHYDNPTGATIRTPLKVSIGAGMRGDWTTIHADAFEANQQPEFNDTIRKCVMEQQPLPICDRSIQGP